MSLFHNLLSPGRQRQPSLVPADLALIKMALPTGGRENAVERTWALVLDDLRSRASHSTSASTAVKWQKKCFLR